MVFRKIEACEFLWIPSKCLRRINEKNQFIERIVGLSIKTNQGTQEFILYVPFEALKVRDQGLHRCPTITLSIIKLILNSFIRQCTFPLKSKETKRSFSFSFKHTLITQWFNEFYPFIISPFYLFFCTQKAERVLGFSRRLFVC